MSKKIITADWLKTKYNWLFSLLLFALPINLFKAFPTGEEYLSGLRVDYLIPKLYISDILVLVLVLGLALPHLRWPKRPAELTLTQSTTLVLSLIVVLAQLYAPLSFIAVLSLIKVLLALTVGFYLEKNLHIVSQTWVTISLSSALIWQAFLALYQWFNQHAFLSYQITGETAIDATIFTAKSTLLHPGYTLPYGSTAHPNVLAGFAAVYGIGLLVSWVNQKKSNIWMSGLIAVGLAASIALLVLTESVSAILTFFGGSYLLGFKMTRRRTLHRMNWYGLAIIGTLILLTSTLAASLQGATNTSISRRAELISNAAQMLVAKPWVGVGAGHFTWALQEFGFDRKLAPFIQPVHNVPLLFLTEYGVIGLLVVLVTAAWCRAGWFAERLPLFFLAILPMVSFDHYLLSLVPGMYLLVFIPLLWRSGD